MSDGQDAFTVVQPGSIDHRVAVTSERALGAFESFNIVVCRLRPGGAEPLEVPAQHVSNHVSQRRGDLRSRLFLHPLSKAGELRRQPDSNGPCRQSAEHRGMALEERAELVMPWIDDQVNEHDAALGM